MKIRVDIVTHAHAVVEIAVAQANSEMVHHHEGPAHTNIQMVAVDGYVLPSHIESFSDVAFSVHRHKEIQQPPLESVVATLLSQQCCHSLERGLCTATMIFHHEINDSGTRTPLVRWGGMCWLKTYEGFLRVRCIETSTRETAPLKDFILGMFHHPKETLFELPSILALSTSAYFHVTPNHSHPRERREAHNVMTMIAGIKTYRIEIGALDAVANRSVCYGEGQQYSPRLRDSKFQLRRAWAKCCLGSQLVNPIGIGTQEEMKKLYAAR